MINMLSYDNFDRLGITNNYFALTVTFCKFRNIIIVNCFMGVPNFILTVRSKGTRPPFVSYEYNILPMLRAIEICTHS